MLSNRQRRRATRHRERERGRESKRKRRETEREKKKEKQKGKKKERKRVETTRRATKRDCNGGGTGDSRFGVIVLQPRHLLRPVVNAAVESAREVKKQLKKMDRKEIEEGPSTPTHSLQVPLSPGLCTARTPDREASLTCLQRRLAH